MTRTGILLGHRAQARPMEAIGQRLATALSPLMVGRLSGYGAIDAKTVAKAIVGLVGQTGNGCRAYDNAAL
ncbi:Rossmann-fold NAD(P)-binding domain-containing protein [Komagataeibacter oboediens]|uniref:hypothetical protein n=1 Tax=Komagataeibacter oboediens TaxID=65958 RepID=UPI000237EED2|nr:hypothetical protein [Komagataeibacter oboediens]